jgi:alcohol dehydrogenase
MKIRAAILTQSGLPAPYAQSLPLQIMQVDLAPPGPGEVLIKIAAAGLCHSDLSVIEGVRPRPLPMALGHESSGIVEEVGPYVYGLKKGDHVVSTFVPACGHCSPCAEGRPALCEPGAAANGAGTLLNNTRRLSCDGAELNHHLGVSCFAEYATVSEHSLVKVAPDMSLEEAALFGCAVLTGVGAAVNTAHIKLGMKVAVIGLGGVGFAGLLGALAAGAEQLVAIDTNPAKLETALSLGATDIFNARDENIVQAVKDATNGGADVVLEFAGAAPALELGYKLCRRGGELVTAGLPPPTAMFSIPAVSLVAEERTIRGSYLGSAVPVRDIPRFIALQRRGRLPVEKLITHRLKLDEINTGMDRLRDGTAIRQIVSM